MPKLSNEASAKATDPLAVPDPRSLPDVRLLEAGVDPRPLRLAYQVGTSVETSLRLVMSTDVSLDGVLIKRVLPPTVTRIRLAVTHASKTRARVEFELLDYTLEEEPAAIPDVVERYKRELAQTVGLKGSAVIDSRGRILAVDLDVEDSEPIDSGLTFVRDALTQVSIPFPREAVGVGGRWVVNERTERAGIASVVETTYEITAIEGEAVTVQYRVEQKGLEGPIESPELPAETTMRLLELVGNGSGMRTLLLGSPKPTSRNESRKVRSRVELSGSGATQQIDSGMSLELSIVESDAP